MTIAVTGGVHRAAVTMTVVMIDGMIDGMTAGMIVTTTVGTTATDGTVMTVAMTEADGVVIIAELIDHVYGAASAAPILFLYCWLLVSFYFS